jgi:hypothetical protein
MRSLLSLLAVTLLATTGVSASITNTSAGPVLDLGYAKYLGWYNTSSEYVPNAL